MNPLPKHLSKTKLLKGYRCFKNIYLDVHQPELASPMTTQTKAVIDEGVLVGIRAREFFPGGTLVENSYNDIPGAIQKTRELIQAGTKTIYEAAFEYNGCYARADIFQYATELNCWNLYEVKSSSHVKPEHYTDVGIQAWIVENCGIAIGKINIVHLNSDCRFPDFSNLFSTVDVTEIVRSNYAGIQTKVNEIAIAINQPQVPDIDIGPHCYAPNDCEFMQHCWSEKEIPDVSIFNLPSIGKKQWSLYADGIIALDDPRLIDLNKLHDRIKRCYETKTRFIDKKLIRSELLSWKFPLIHLDFETINPAIPRFNGCKPYSQIPFQFSIHQLNSLEAEAIHHEFLYELEDDPRPQLINFLLQGCGAEGSIVAYNAAFESTQIKGLANDFPQYREALLALTNRIVDPLPIFRAGVYDNAFSGSFSLKYVAPALLGDAHSYDGMLVANGSDAQLAYAELTSPLTSSERKAELKNGMIEYCKKDTFVMVELVKWLYRQADLS